MKTILLFFLSMAAVFAADPAQPKVGQTPVINATNGFGGNLTVRTQLNVGYPNQAGLIQILSTNGTFTGTLSLNDQGTFVLTDDVTDGASAVAFSFNSSNVLSTPGAKLATFGNGGTNEIVLLPWGGVGLGANTEANFGGFNVGDILIFESDTTLGDHDGGQIYFESMGAASSRGTISGSFDSVSATLNITGILPSFAGYNSVVMRAAPDGSVASFEILGPGASELTILWPLVADGSTPYTLDTSLAHTSGNLLEVKNMGTNFYVFDAFGGLNLVAPSPYLLIQGDSGAVAQLDTSDLTMNPDGFGDRVILRPAIGDSATAFSFDTSLTHTSGNLAEFKNNGVLDFAVSSTNGIVYTLGPASGSGFLAQGSDDSSSTWVFPYRIYNQNETLGALGFLLDPTVGDGATAYFYNTQSTHTSGDILDIYNNGTLVDAIAAVSGWTGTGTLFKSDDGTYKSAGGGGTTINSNDGFIPVRGSGTAFTNSALQNISSSAIGIGSTSNVLASSGTDLVYTNGAAEPNFFVKNGSGNNLQLGLNAGGNGFISAISGSVYYGAQIVSQDIQPLTDNTYRLGINGGNRFESVNAYGFASSATDAAVTIAATGWTNTFGKNAVVYMDGIGLTFTVYNKAGTAVYTNSVALAGDSVLLQPSGKVIITGGTLGVGRATPF